MARAIKHIKAGLLHVEVIGTIPEREPGRRRAAAAVPPAPPSSSTTTNAPGMSWS